MRSSIGFLFALLLCNSAYAVVEFKAHYGLQQYDPTLLNEGAPSALKFKEQTTMGADLTYSFWEQQIVVGVRAEQSDEELSSSDGTRKIELSHVDALLGYRFMSGSSGYLGVLASIPVSGKVDMTENDGTLFEANSKKISGYRIGLQGTYFLTSLFSIGAEVGQTAFKTKSFASNLGPDATYNGEPLTIDFEGLYYKILVGVFF